MTPLDDANADRDTTRSPVAAQTPDEDSAPNATLVHDAIDAGDLRRAYRLILNDRWAAALHDDGTGEFADATYRAACAAVLDDPRTFLSLQKRYPDIFERESEILLRLQPAAGDWASLRVREQLPPALCNFATQISVARGTGALHLARDLSAWYWSDPDAALALFRRIYQSSLEVTPLLIRLLEPFAAQVATATGELPLPPQPDPASVLRRFVILNIALAVAVTAAVAATFLALGWVNRTTMGSTLAVLLVALYAGSDLFDRRPALQRQFLDACLGANVEPKVAAQAIQINPLLRSSIERSQSLALGFLIGRLARLGSGSESCVTGHKG